MTGPSSIPNRETRELRDSTRRRKQLIGFAVDEQNRVQRLRQEGDVQLGIVLSDLLDEPGLRMLHALVNQEVIARADRGFGDSTSSE